MEVEMAAQNNVRSRDSTQQQNKSAEDNLVMTGYVTLLLEDGEIVPLNGAPGLLESLEFRVKALVDEKLATARHRPALLRKARAARFEAELSVVLNRCGIKELFFCGKPLEQLSGQELRQLLDEEKR